MVFSKRRLNSLGVFRHLVEKLHNTCTSQLVSSVVFERSYFIGSRDVSRDYLDIAVFIVRITKREAEGIATLRSSDNIRRHNKM